MRIPEAVPPLRGTAKKLVGFAWWALFALTFASSLFGAPLASQRIGDLTRACASLGLRCESSPTGLVLQAPIDPALESRGIHAGLRIARIDGQATPSNDASASATLLDGPQGAEVALVLEDRDSRVTTHRLVRDERWLELAVAPMGLDFDTVGFLLSLLWTVSGLVTCVLALVLFVRGHGAPAAILISFGLLLVVVDDNLGGFGGQRLYDVLRVGNIVGGLCLAAAPLLFPSGRFTPRWSFWVLLAAPLWWLFLYFGGLQATPAYLVGFLAFQVVSLCSVVVRYRQASAGIEKQQIRWAALGFGLSMLCYGLTAAASPWLTASAGPDTWITTFGTPVLVSMGTTLFPLGLTIALVRYRLYDAEAVMSRSVAYGALTLLLLAIFAGSEKVIEVLGEQYFGGSLGAFAGGLGAAIAAVMIVPLHKRLDRWAEKRFQKDLTHLREGLPLLVGDLRETASLPELAEAVLRRCQEGVRATRALLLAEGRILHTRGVDPGVASAWLAAWRVPEVATMECDRGDPLFPMRVALAADGVGTVGWLLLGPRPDGSAHGKDEREALAEIADPVARALAIVRRREAQAARLEQRFAAIESALVNARVAPA